MNDLRTAAQQALEALEWLKQRGLFGDFHGVADTLRAALAEPVQEAEWEVRADGKRVSKDRWQIGIRRIVALLWGNRREFEIDEVIEAVRGLVPNPHAEGDDEARVSAALAEPVQPVAWRLWDEDPQGGGDWRYYDAKDFKNGINPTEYFDGLVPLYTAPPQRKPPTGEEVEQCFRDAGITIKGHRWTIAARNVEAAHGIK